VLNCVEWDRKCELESMWVETGHKLRFWIIRLSLP